MFLHQFVRVIRHLVSIESVLIPLKSVGYIFFWQFGPRTPSNQRFAARWNGDAQKTCVSRMPCRRDYFCTAKKSVTRSRRQRIGNGGMRGVSVLERRRCEAPGAALHTGPSDLWFLLGPQLARRGQDRWLRSARTEIQKLRNKIWRSREGIYWNRETCFGCANQ